MADIQQTATVEVQVNGEQAKNELQSLEKYATSLKDRIADAYSTGDTKKMKELEKELKKTNSQLRTMRTNAVNIDEVMQNLSAAGPKELQKTLKAINKELESGRIKRGSQEWNEYQAKLKLVNAEIRKIKSEGVEAESFLSRMNGKLAKWGGMIASAAVAITGLSMAFSKMRKDSMDKEESQDNLNALTGLDDESIAWLTQQAETLSTTMDASGLRVKQSSQEILDAYTLVGSAKPELLSNKEALNGVTVETMRLSTAAKMDLKEAVDAVTLSMNQYGASADEAAKYTNVMAAGSKYGSVAVQSITAAVIKAGVSASGADVSIEQLVGSIETLGEKGIKDEVAGTGLKTFFLRLQTGADDTNPKIVGLQTALKNLQKLSTQDILKRFGQESYTVAQTLIAGADKVDYYTKAVTGTNVATEQAAINSDNAAAKMAQMKNQLKEAGIELMEKLNPSVNLLGSYFTNLIKFMPPLIDFLQKYGAVIIGMLVPLVTYLTLTKLQTYWIKKYGEETVRAVAIQKLKDYWTKICIASEYLYVAALALCTGATRTASLATKQFFLTLSLNPIFAVIALFGALVYAIYRFSKGTAEASKGITVLMRQTKLMDDVNKKTNDSLIEQKSKIDLLVWAIHNENTANANRKKAIKQLQEIIPSYNAEITKEGEIIRENKKAIEDYIKAIEREAKAKAIQETVTELYKKKVPHEMALKSAENKISEITSQNQYSSSQDPYAQSTVNVLSGAIQFNKSELDKIDSDINYLQELLGSDLMNLNADGGGGGNGDKDAVAKATKELDAKFAKAKAEQTALYSIGKMDKQEYDAFVQDSEMKLLDSKMNLYAKESKEYNDLLQQKLQMQVKQNQDCQKEDVQSVDERTKEAKRQLLDSYTDQNIDKKAFEEGLLQLDYDAIEAKRDIYVKGSKEYEDYQKQLDDLAYQDKLRRQQSYEEKIKQFKQEYQKKTADQLMQDEINAWDILHKKGALKEAEYQQIILSIKNKYSIQKGQEEVGYGYNERKYAAETSQLVDQAKAKTGNVGNPETDSIWDSMFGNDAKLHAGVTENLKSMEEQGLMSHKQYLIAKGQADNEYYTELERKASTVYAQISGIMSSYSSYVTACQDVETSKIEKKYDKEISAAGKNSAKVAKLEDAKEKEIAKVKSKYNKKNNTIQIAKAIAETAIGALKAYNSAWELGPILGPILGPVFAGMALASGMLQVATIKKQAQAQEAGYYNGGFTPSGRWDEEKGAVHAGEFVANRYAVRNKQILPVLRLIDNAQKNNTIGSLTAQDVTSVLSGGQTIPSAAAGAEAGSGADSSAESLAVMLEYTYSVIDRLNKRLEKPFQTINAVDGPDGIKQAIDKYDSLQRNKSRV